MRVCIIQPVMKKYRVPFFAGLREALLKEGISLEVVYGTPWKEEAKRGDHAELPASLGRKVRTIRIFRKLFVQPTVTSWVRADLIILEHANKHVLNYVLMFLHGLGLKRIAYWGHGRDRQVSITTAGERLKRLTLHWTDWWFAYTKGAADYVKSQGYENDRITIVENAVDTRGFRELLSDVTSTELQETRVEFGWGYETRIGVYCGSLYENKRIDLLFNAVDIVYEKNNKFRLLIIGGGPLACEVEDFCREREWVRYVGPTFGRKKATLLRLAEFWLNPGLVGLGILDAFCAGLPVLTTNVPVHSPEIEYLEEGYNGLMVEAEEHIYASAVVRLIDDASMLLHLQQGALASGMRYSVENMVGNFAEGIKRCLSAS